MFLVASFRLILTNYVALRGDTTGLVGAMSVSAAWDVFASVKTLEEPLNAFLFNRHLTDNLISQVTRSVTDHYGNQTIGLITDTVMTGLCFE